VTVALPAAKATVVRDHARVQVELPSNEVVRGRVIEVGNVATKPSGDAEPAIAVRIRLTGDTDAPDGAPVTVDFETERAKDALTVPVTALMARPGGRFAVEVHEGGGRRIVPVSIGLYTDSDVQISGGGLRPGLVVSDGKV
jgi:hypothetical protein